MRSCLARRVGSEGDTKSLFPHFLASHYGPATSVRELVIPSGNLITESQPSLSFKINDENLVFLYLEGSRDS